MSGLSSQIQQRYLSSSQLLKMSPSSVIKSPQINKRSQIKIPQLNTCLKNVSLSRLFCHSLCLLTLSILFFLGILIKRIVSTCPNSPINTLIAFLIIISSSMYFIALIVDSPFHKRIQGFHTMSLYCVLNTF